ncbi:MAG: CAP domain-containing protein [Ilumatobacteraceae bacterium]
MGTPQDTASRTNTGRTNTATSVDRPVLAVVARLVALAVALVAGLVLPATAPAAAAGVDDHDWLGIVNSYRTMSGLDPVVENPTWSQQGREHARYMLLNGITHVQDPSKPGHTEGGALAGAHGNVATSSNVDATPRRFVDLWMTGPFHAIGLLRHNLTSSGFGLASDPDTSPWRAGATLDVLRGLTPGMPRTTVTVFPGRDATVAVDRFVAEHPDPVELVGWSGPAGLPLVALMTNTVTTAQASLDGPDGPVEVRVLHGGDPGSGAGADIAEGIMKSDDAVVVVPRDPLAPGTYTATVTSDGGSVTWSFTIDPDAPLPLAPTTAPAAGATPSVDQQPADDVDDAPAPDTRLLAEPSGFVPASPFRLADTRASKHLLRLEAGHTTSVPIGEPGDVAVSLNITVDRPAGPGFLSVQGADVEIPIVSTVNFLDRPAANHVVAPIEDGRLGVHASVDTDLIIDVNGFFRTDGGHDFVPTEPGRVLDTRAAGQFRLAAGERRTVPVVGVPGGAPADAEVVALNLTVVEAEAAGYLSVWPTGLDRVEVSNVNVTAGETRPNSALVAVGDDGTITIEASVDAHVLVDVTGHLVEPAEGGLRFTPVEPIRLLDSRATGATNPATDGTRLPAGSSVRIPVAGHRGVPADTRAVWVNVTAVDPARAGYVTVSPGGNVPTTSTLNTDPATPAVANGALVSLDAEGGLTVHADHDVHVLVDLTGIWG